MHLSTAPRIVIAIIAFACASVVIAGFQEHPEGTALPPRTPAAARHASAGEAAAAYSTGWGAMMDALVAAHSNAPTSASPRLRALLDEVRPAMAWGHLRQDNVMTALSNGSKEGIWVMLIDPGHDRLLQPGPTMSTTLDGDLHVIMLRPDRMTERWAGIFLVHEMSHALDQRKAESNPGCAAEFEAYRVEREAMNVLTSGGLDEALDEAIGRYVYASYEDVIAAVEADTGNGIGPAIDGIESRLAEPPPLSAAEREMRDGFYVLSLADRIGERADVGMEARCEIMARVIRATSKY